MKKSYIDCISNQAVVQFSTRFIPTVEKVITEQSTVMVVIEHCAYLIVIIVWNAYL